MLNPSRQDFLAGFDFGINVEAIGVTCEGAKAPVILLLNYLLVSLIIVLFDSNFYFVVKAAWDFRLHKDETDKYTR